MTTWRVVSGAMLVAALVMARPSRLVACPFCVSLGPTLSERRASAETMALGELLEVGGEPSVLTVRLHYVLAGDVEAGETLHVEAETKARAGTLVLLIGQRAAGGESHWEAVVVDETSFAYVARAPDLRQPEAKRLRYFVDYLEHPDPLVAEDAYAEFARADYDVVATVADRFSAVKLVAWIESPLVPAVRKGFYGLALALAPHVDGERPRAEVMRELIESNDDGFRAGLDGLLGGYLLAGGETSIASIESHILADRQAADEWVRHAMKALAFSFEYGDSGLRPDLCRALRHLLLRPEFAAAAIIDLARWQDWEMTEPIAGLWNAEGYPQPGTNRAIVGFLLHCPSETAANELKRLREMDPVEVAAAEERLRLFGGGR